MEQIVIAEKTNPKSLVVSFKVNKEEKEFIQEFCEKKDYRLSAAMRVLVLNGINEAIRKEEERDGKKT